MSAIPAPEPVIDLGGDRWSFRCDLVATGEHRGEYSAKVKVEGETLKRRFYATEELAINWLRTVRAVVPKRIEDRV